MSIEILRAAADGNYNPGELSKLFRWAADEIQTLRQRISKPTDSQGRKLDWEQRCLTCNTQWSANKVLPCPKCSAPTVSDNPHD